VNLRAQTNRRIFRRLCIPYARHLVGLSVVALLLCAWLRSSTSRATWHAVHLPFPVRTFGVELELPLRDSSDFNDEKLRQKGSYLTEAFDAQHYTYYTEEKSASVIGDHWRLALEDDPGYLIEVASPKLHSWQDVEKITQMTTQWVEGPPGPPGKIKNLTTDVIPRFYWSGDDCTHCSMHVTIDGSCLLQGADLTQLRRGKGPPMEVSAIGVLNFVAVWEAMYPLLVPEFGKRLGMMQYGGSMKEKSRKLFDALMTQANTTVGGVVQSYMDFGYEDLVADQAEYLGFRNLLVNLCHLMPVPLRCSRDSSHNEKPKHTGVEIRMFDVAAGEKAKQVLLLVFCANGSLCIAGSWILYFIGTKSSLLYSISQRTQQSRPSRYSSTFGGRCQIIHQRVRKNFFL